MQNSGFHCNRKGNSKNLLVNNYWPDLKYNLVQTVLGCLFTKIAQIDLIP